MKLNIKLIAALGLLIVSANSCTDRFEELNTNPNTVTEDIIDPDLLFTRVEKVAVFSLYDGTEAAWAGYTVNTGAAYFRTMDRSGIYNNSYKSYLINLNEVIRLTADNPDLINKNSIARIFRVWVYQRLTDTYGDVPYTEAALKAEDAITSPAYDTQESIYVDMLKELKEASALLNDNGDLIGFGDADLLYAGDVNKWRRFANSLRLRLAMRIRYADKNLAKDQVTDVLKSDLLSGNDDNASITTNTDVRDNMSPIYLNWDAGDRARPWIAGQTIVENLKKNNDPRLPVYVDPAPDGTSGYRGLPIALYLDEKLAYPEGSFSFIGAYFYSSPIIKINILTYAEVEFLRAEAALLGWGTGDAETYYRDGITAAMQNTQKLMEMAEPEVDIPGSVALTDAEVNGFLSSEAAMLDGNFEENLEKIITQKYIALFPLDSYEAFAEQRRTGYPKIWVGSDPGDTGNKIPRRMNYPFDEKRINSASYAEVVGRMADGDVLTARVWWDANPNAPYVHPKQGMFPPN
jgi:hypothetical protein